MSCSGESKREEVFRTEQEDDKAATMRETVSAGGRCRFTVTPTVNLMLKVTNHQRASVSIVSAPKMSKVRIQL